MANSETRLIVLISGSGTNLQALIDACINQTIPNARIIRVVSNRKAACNPTFIRYVINPDKVPDGLVRAQNAEIPTRYHNLLDYKKCYPGNTTQARAEFDKDLARYLLEDCPDLVVCAGWMHILSPNFLNPLETASIPIINLHPALPGAFNGANAIERAHKDWVEGKVEKTGVMIHRVISEVDMGDPILVQEIPFVKGLDEDLQTLKQRIHEIEWKAIVSGTGLAIKELIVERAKKEGTK